MCCVRLDRNLLCSVVVLRPRKVVMTLSWSCRSNNGNKVFKMARFIVSAWLRLWLDAIVFGFFLCPILVGSGEAKWLASRPPLAELADGLVVVVDSEFMVGPIMVCTGFWWTSVVMVR